jgi:hypothetical protein
MPITLTQTPASTQLAQSPIIATVNIGDSSYTSSGFQYTCDLEYWSGSTASSSISTYTLIKYPNSVGAGIFDFSNILNSSFKSNAVQTTSSAVYYKATFNSRYYSASSWVANAVSTSFTFKAAYDGYNLWPEEINSDINIKGLYPFLTDGPATQSVYSTDLGTLSAEVYNTQYGITYVGSNGSTATVNVTGSTNSFARIKRVPIGLAEANFPISKVGLDYFTISSGSISIRFDVKCEPKYTPVRIGFKNRFGQLDFFTFNKVSRKSFTTTQKTYSPNAGNWGGSTFSVDQYVNQSQKYIVDNQEYLDVNTDYILESYNEIFKQLMVSDEVYWYTNGRIIPLSIETSDVQFKTGVVDKLISYQFRFIIGQNFKFIV